ncbi:MAG: hypothetical protein GX808_14260 [Syntrophomonadaceae bacterium]|jgi:hypothetical protein|nr:hypothetical protein [Syntrophomonadaceae bacterium]
MDFKNKKLCACCGKPTLEKDSLFEICEVCGWQDDAVQNDDPGYAGGANEMSLNEAREAYRKGKKVV